MAYSVSFDRNTSTGGFVSLAMKSEANPTLIVLHLACSAQTCNLVGVALICKAQVTTQWNPLSNS